MSTRFRAEPVMRPLQSTATGVHLLRLVAMILLLASVLSGCEKAVYHGVLASNGGYITSDFVEIVSEETVDGLTVRRVRASCDEDPSSYGEWLELDGYYGSQGAELMSALLPDLAICREGDDPDHYIWVALNGQGGTVMDGVLIGRLLRQHRVEAGLTWGQSCRASCAGAFLGAESRFMYGDASLHFNVPFEASYERSIDCADKNEWGELRDYTSEMLEQVVASALLKDMLEECENPAGRMFNRTAAQSLGLLSEE